MLAAVLHGKEQLRVESVSVPEVTAGDILVRVRTALTCGTDLKVFRRGYHAKMIQPPAVLGHELAGDIVAVGDGVTSFSIGQRVVAANSAPCWDCYFCRKGQENLCEDLLFNNGAYAEYVRIPSPIVDCNTHVIPDNISYREAAMVEPLACVLRGVEESGIQPGDTVTVIGLGPIGMMFVSLAKLAGARVLAVGRRPQQLERALEIGADEGILSGEDLDGKDASVEAVRQRAGEGRGSDIVIEAVGSPSAWRSAVGMVRSGGTINFFGGCPTGSQICLETSRIHYSELTIKSSFHHTPKHISEALAILASRRIDADKFVISEAPLTDILDVFRHLMSHNGHLKTAILPNGADR